jgi:hypothetical protein
LHFSKEQFSVADKNGVKEDYIIKSEISTMHWDNKKDALRASWELARPQLL